MGRRDQSGVGVDTEATLESDATKALGKGCTVAGAFTPLAIGSASSVGDRGTPRGTADALPQSNGRDHTRKLPGKY
jgi:hypothetical protein